MNPPKSSTPPRRFRGGVRHYHRAGAPSCTWDHWVDGKNRPVRAKRPWLRIALAVLAALALAGIVIGLYVEMS